MRQDEIASPRPLDERQESRLHRYVLAVGVLWSVAVAVSLGWNLVQLDRNLKESARVHARTSFQKDVLYRRWNASNGAVYGAASARTPPNPYLEADERDIRTPSGRELTLINPAYMTRQVHELGAAANGVLGHITSLNPIRPGNRADPWEASALQAFERGEDECSAVQDIQGTPYMRLMRPLLTEQGCLKCHAAQGYKQGDVRGGISIAIPMAPLDILAQNHAVVLVVGHAALWLLGLGGILGGGRSVGTAIGKRRQAEAESERLEGQLRQRQRLASIGTLAAGMAHEINNPITGMINYAQLIKDAVGEEEELGEFATDIIAEGTRVAAIIRSLLTFSHQQGASHSPADMSEIVRGTLTLVQAMLTQEGIGLEVKVAADLPLVRCHREQLKQVLLALVLNARDALKERYPRAEDRKGEAITITVSEEEGADGRRVRIVVEDRGAGVPNEVAGRIFDPFFTTKDRAESAGLGLSVSHGIVAEHGGELRLESVPGEYTRFWFDLPVSDPPEPEEAKSV